MKKIFFAGFLFHCLLLQGQQHFNFQNFDTRDGLSHFEVTCLYKDSYGFLWIGTTFGLNRFDGTTFENFYHDPDLPYSIADNKIVDITEDAQRQLWITTVAGLNIFHPGTNHFTTLKNIPLADGEHITPKFTSVFRDSDDDMWLGNNEGSVIYYESRSNTYHNIPVSLNPPGRVQNRYVGRFLEDDKGRLWVATSYGIYQLDKAKKTATSFRFDSSWPEEGQLNATISVFQTHGGILLAGTWNAGVLLFDETARQFRPLQDGSKFLPNPVVFDFSQRDSIIFIATIGGLYTCSEHELTRPGFSDFQLITHHPLVPNSYAAGTPTWLLEDGNEYLWIGGSEGFSQLNIRQAYYKSYTLPFPSTLSITADKQQLYLIEPGGMHVFDLGREELVQSRFSFQSGILHRMDKSNEHFYLSTFSGSTRFTHAFTKEKVFAEFNAEGNPYNIYRTLEDQAGNVWLVTSRFGIIQYDTKGKSTFFLNDPSKPVHSVGYIIGGIAEGKDGTIYAGGKRLFIKRKSADDFSAISILNDPGENEITSLKMQDGILWIGARSGLYSYSEESGKLQHHPFPAFVNQVIEELEVDKAGRIWIITPSGLMQYTPKDNIIVELNERNGWPRNFSTLIALEDGRIAACSENQLLLISPEKLQTKNPEGKALITKVSIDENDISFLPQQDTLFRVRYGQNIRLAYTIPNYVEVSNALYEWQLTGLDDQWHAAGNNKIQSFNSLSPGRYIFSVRPLHQNLYSNTSRASVHFMVLPPFYLSWWFILVALLCISTLLFLFYRYRLTKALQMERMRTRIATDLHDDIGSTLSSISFYSDAVYQQTKNKLPEVTPILEKMGETSRSMVSSMSDIVWAINPQNDDMGKMVDRMKSYVKEWSILSGKEILIHPDEHILHLKLNLDQRRNIFLIFKEAIHNAIKYAECTSITVMLTFQQDIFKMLIQDDGTGFEVNEDREGNGIRNMQRRASDLGASIEIQSERNKGTRIYMEMPI